MDIINTIIGNINTYLYTYILVILLVAGGLYFSIRTKFVQFRLLGEQFKSLTDKPKGKGGVSSFQALMVSTASRVGTGNIMGVAAALCFGGFGAIFWMWVIALIGAASAFVESTLAQIYKKKGKDGCYGGPSHYIEQGLKLKWLAIIFSVLLIFTYGVGFNMIASNKLQATFAGYSFYNADLTPWIIGAIIAIAVGYCLFGGGKRLVKTTAILVPIMGVIYILVALVITIINAPMLPGIFGRIFSEAFDLGSLFGGVMGMCIIKGIQRGLYSNEAGIGSAPNAAASAEVYHPANQGLVQVLSVFIDTILICTATAFMLMSSGVEPTGFSNESTFVQVAMTENMGVAGPIFITVAMVLFAFTTLIGNIYYVDKCINHLFGKEPPKWIRNIIYVAASLIILLGAGLSSSLLWDIADVSMGLMALIHIPVIVILGKYAFRALKDYDKQRKEGKKPVFLAKNIGLEGKTDYWQEENNDLGEDQ